MHRDTQASVIQIRFSTNYLPCRLPLPSLPLPSKLEDTKLVLSEQKLEGEELEVGARQNIRPR